MAEGGRRADVAQNGRDEDRKSPDSVAPHLLVLARSEDLEYVDFFGHGSENRLRNAFES